MAVDSRNSAADSFRPITRKLGRPVITSAFVGTNPTDELITSAFAVIRRQSEARSIRAFYIHLRAIIV